jgi:hypothetical protein
MPKTNLTKPQFNALWRAFQDGAALYANMNGVGGGYRQMCERLADDQLLTDAPYRLTEKGRRALRDACEDRWNKDSCMAYHDDLAAVEASLS